MLSKLKIRTRLALMATVPLVLIGLLMGSTYFLVKHLAVNGPAYERIVANKDFIAEVQVPDLYLIRAQMLMQQLARPEANPGERAGLRGEIDQVEIHYDDTYALWKDRITDPKQKAYLEDSYDAAKQYFDLYRRQFRVLQEDGKDARANEVLDGPMQIAYLQHQSAMESVAGVTATNIARAEQKASDQTREQMALLALCMIALVILSAALGLSTVRSITRRIRKLSHVATVELPEMIETVKQSTLAGDEVTSYRPIELGGNDELTDATHAFNAVLGTAVELASQQSKIRRSTSEMFVNLGRRNHKLLSRTLSYISELERDERDPSTLQKLFKLDHLATRMRRHAESLLVLAGSAPLRTWSRPVPVGDVLRAALSEIEAYDRVDISSLEPMSVQGSAVSDLAHLMAELLENATTFSPPHTRVRILGRGRGGPEGYTLVVVDEGLGMTPQEMALANHHLAMAGADLTRLPGNSRMLGLGVVGRLAARHGLEVSLGDAPLGGTVARVTLPDSLLTPPVIEEETEKKKDPADDETAVLNEAAAVFAAKPPTTGMFSAPASVGRVPAPGTTPAPTPGTTSGPTSGPTSAAAPAPAIPVRTPAVPAPSAPLSSSQISSSQISSPPISSAPLSSPPASAPALPVRSAPWTSALTPSTPSETSTPAETSTPSETGTPAGPTVPGIAGIPAQPGPARPAPSEPAQEELQPAVPTPLRAQLHTSPQATVAQATHSGQSPEPAATEQVGGEENAYVATPDGPSSVTVGTHPTTTGSLPSRKPAHRPADDSPAAPQQNSAQDGAPQSGTTPSPEGEKPEIIGGLRRRVRGENLPDTVEPEPQEPITPRDADGVRAALSSFKAGRDLANRDS